MTEAWALTDSEIRRELETATGERKKELEAQVAEREQLRSSLPAYDPTLS